MVSIHNEFVDYVVELMAGWAGVRVRKMFGGYGVYREELMFALIADDQLYFKTDAANEAEFKRAGSRPFIYVSGTRTVQMSYWSASESSLESAVEMHDWCVSAYAAAMRAHAIKTRKVNRTKKVGNKKCN